MNVMQRSAALLGAVLMPLAMLALLALLTACGGGSGTPIADPDGDAPAFAAGFVAQGSSESTVSLGWTRWAGASGYTIERRSAPGAWTTVATLDAQAQHFLDEGLQRSTRYSYRVRAEGSALQAERTAETGDEAPLLTAFGAAAGDPVVGSIGSAGGRLASADGRFRVDVPAGALAGDAVLRLQPITNTAPEGLGEGLRLEVTGELTSPLLLTVAYDEPLSSDADGLGVALQRPDGGWIAMPVKALDKDKRTLTLELDGRLRSGPLAPAMASAQDMGAASVMLDFRLVLYRNFYLSPRQAQLKVGETQVFVPYAYTRGVIGTVCRPDAVFGCVPMPLIGAQALPFENSTPGYERRWYVFAQEGGDAISGTLTPRDTTGAVYQAPARVPDVNPVLVSFVSKHRASGRTVTVTARVTVKEPVWTGIARGTLSAPDGDLAFSFSIEAVWTPEVPGNVTRFIAQGTQSVAVIELRCSGSVSPSSAALQPGALVIDDSISPARYTLDVGSLWRTTLTGTCPGRGSAHAPFDVPSRLVVEGTLGEDGSSISGSTVMHGISWDWALSSAL